jgi:hypothetical protein
MRVRRVGLNERSVVAWCNGNKGLPTRPAVRETEAAPVVLGLLYNSCRTAAEIRIRTVMIYIISKRACACGVKSMPTCRDGCSQVVIAKAKMKIRTPLRRHHPERDLRHVPMPDCTHSRSFITGGCQSHTEVLSPLSTGNGSAVLQIQVYPHAVTELTLVPYGFCCCRALP